MGTEKKLVRACGIVICLAKERSRGNLDELGEHLLRAEIDKLASCSPPEIVNAFVTWNECGGPTFDPRGGSVRHSETSEQARRNAKRGVGFSKLGEVMVSPSYRGAKD